MAMGGPDSLATRGEMGDPAGAVAAVEQAAEREVSGTAVPPLAG